MKTISHTIPAQLSGKRLIIAGFFGLFVITLFFFQGCNVKDASFFTPPLQQMDSTVPLSPVYSSVTATSPHIADGMDASTVTIDLRDQNNNPMIDFDTESFSINLTGSAQATNVTSDDENGQFSLEVTNSVEETVILTVTAGGTELENKPQIEFKGVPLVIPGEYSVDYKATDFTCDIDNIEFTVSATIELDETDITADQQHMDVFFPDAPAPISGYFFPGSGDFEGTTGRLDFGNDYTIEENWNMMFYPEREPVAFGGISRVNVFNPQGTLYCFIDFDIYGERTEP